MASNPEPEKAFFEEGAIVGNYRIGRLVAQGGMGCVYEARHQILQRTAAIKIVRSDMLHAVAARDGLLREAQILSCIVHPGIARVWDAGVLEDGRPWIAMELLEGESLGELLARRGTLSAAEVAGILLALIEPLSLAHAQGVVHRDLKPENILLRQEEGIWNVKLIDWGIAHVDGHAELHGSVTAGTPHYMAPEQVRGEPVDGRTDVYALGIVAHELLTGEPPFSGENPTAIAMAQLRQAPPPITDPAVPPALVALVQTMLAKSPAGRPALEVVRADLDAILADGAGGPAYELDFTVEDVPSMQPLAVVGKAQLKDVAPVAPSPRWTPSMIPLHARDTRPMGHVWSSMGKARATVAGVVNIKGPRRAS